MNAADHAEDSPSVSVPAETVQILVLTHPAAPVPARLMQALQRRGSRVQLVTDAPMLMAELALAQRPVVIINQAQRFAHLERLLAAMGDYYPQVDCWAFDEHSAGQSPRFVPLADTRTATPSDEASTSLKIHRDDEPIEDDTEPLLTAEELAMLLGHAQQADPL